MDGLLPMKCGFLDCVIPAIHHHWVTCKLCLPEMLPPCCLLHVHPGTIIHSDQWRAYNRVSSLPPVASHSVVNHSLHFVDPATGTHTQNIELYWERVKRKIKNMKGCHATELTSYLDEFMWRERYGKTKTSAFRNICQDISIFYLV